MYKGILTFEEEDEEEAVGQEEKAGATFDAESNRTKAGVAESIIEPFRSFIPVCTTLHVGYERGREGGEPPKCFQYSGVYVRIL